MHRTIYYSLILIAVHMAVAVAQSQTPPVANAYHVSGRCHDNNTAVGLKARVYALIGQSRKQLAVCSSEGIFDVLLPTTATHLVLEMDNYRPVSIPVHFAPDLPQNARFLIFNRSMMTPLDSVPEKLSARDENFLSLYFDVADDVDFEDVQYSLTSLATSQKRWFSAPAKRLKGGGIPFSVDPDTYTDTLSTRDGRFISSENVTVYPGITFKAIRVVKPAQLTGGSNSITPSLSASPTVVSVYFDQSSYVLRPKVKVTLDSMAGILTGQSSLRATLTGYSDNVGKRDLNVILSEYRVKTVANYLRQHGVLANQLIAKWNGPDSTASPDDTETIKSQSRRVTIRVSPK